VSNATIRVNVMRTGTLPLFVALAALTGCAVKATLDWQPMPVYEPADVASARPEGETGFVLKGEPAPADGLVVEPAYLEWLETIAYDVYPDTVDAIGLLQSGRAADRDYASTEYADAVGKLRSRMDGVCALCAGLGAGAAAGVGAAVCGAK